MLKSISARPLRKTYRMASLPLVLSLASYCLCAAAADGKPETDRANHLRWYTRRSQQFPDVMWAYGDEGGKELPKTIPTPNIVAAALSTRRTELI